jgi:hypothetical protein
MVMLGDRPKELPSRLNMQSRLRSQGNPLCCGCAQPGNHRSAGNCRRRRESARRWRVFVTHVIAGAGDIHLSASSGGLACRRRKSPSPGRSGVMLRAMSSDGTEFEWRSSMA